MDINISGDIGTRVAVGPPKSGGPRAAPSASGGRSQVGPAALCTWGARSRVGSGLPFGVALTQAGAARAIARRDRGRLVGEEDAMRHRTAATDPSQRDRAVEPS